MQSRGGNHKKVLCTSEACPFFVQLYRKLSKADSKSWYVSSLNLQHMNCSSVAKPTKRQLAELPAFRNAVLGAPDAAIGHLIRQMQGEEGIALQKRLRTVYRARDAIKEAIASDNAALYKKIPSLMREFMRLNPRSCALLDRDEQGRFQRAFLASEVFIDAFPHNQRMLGLTSTLFDCSDFHGVQLLLHARDGNFGHIKMAMAIVDAETQENYEWFLTTVVESARLHGLQSVPILCEPVHELVSAAKKLNLLLCFANAQDLQPSYGWQPATFVRTEGMIVPKESPFMHLQNMMSELMKEAFERHRTSVKWQDEGRKVTPQAELLFQQQLKEVGRFVVEECSESIAFVYDAAQVPRNRVRVDLATCSCSCMYMAQFEIPCKHLLALLSHNNTLDKAFEFFGACFQVHNYAASYRSKCVQIPIDSDLVNDDSVHPPKKQRKGGRGRSPGTPGTPTGAGAAGFSATALAEAGSVASKVGGAAARAARGVERSGETKVYRCGNCGRDGHNKRSCEALGAQTTTQCDLEQFSQVI
ncbi:TPA: hypothetical protein N0F65_007500 [Lagenidium giganteum]|uniref:SWIM-type domain-containing protein n=1 Tax=Lagenidium giganteum TaxID=4803 RepID=A0AAV2ZCZ4_9STRA|nr:TPA: hypothetical protein N0F65_007500 [Lagenidium giganteum]